MQPYAGESELRLDSVGPIPIVTPSQLSFLAECVRQAAASGEAIFPIGGRTMLDYGLAPTRSGRAVDLHGLNRVLDYPADDLTITVEAGCTLEEVQNTLRPKRQWLPLDVPVPDRATVGGALACNLPGFRRYGYGSWRDYVLAMTVVNDQGQAVRSGARVVKNVAGYDLHKLHIGALGSLGIIAEVTFKLRPMPESRMLLCWRCLESALPALLERVHQSCTRPVGLAVLNNAAAHCFDALRPWADPSSYLIVIGLEEKLTTVRWQKEQLNRELQTLADCQAVGEFDDFASPVWQGLTDFILLPSASCTFRAQVLPSQVVAVLRAVRHLGNAAVTAYAGSGTIYGHWFELNDRSTLARFLEALRATAAGVPTTPRESAPSPGKVVLLRCPHSWKTPELVWGQSSPDAFLQRRIKETFDPKNLFNPGRFPAGW